MELQTFKILPQEYQAQIKIEEIEEAELILKILPYDLADKFFKEEFEIDMEEEFLEDPEDNSMADLAVMMFNLGEGTIQDLIKKWKDEGLMESEFDYWLAGAAFVHPKAKDLYKSVHPAVSRS